MYGVRTSSTSFNDSWGWDENNVFKEQRSPKVPITQENKTDTVKSAVTIYKALGGGAQTVKTSS